MERKRERERERNPTKGLMILIVCLCRGLRESGRGAGLGRTWNGSGCGFAGRRILGWFRAQGQEGSRSGEGAGSPSIRRPLRRSGQITKGPVRVQRGTSRPPGSLSTSGQFASFPAADSRGPATGHEQPRSTLTDPSLPSRIRFVQDNGYLRIQSRSPRNYAASNYPTGCRNILDTWNAIE